MDIADRLVIGHHNGSVFPHLVADDENEHAWLVDALLREDNPTETWFHVWGGPATFPGPQGKRPRRWLRIGYHGGYGAAFFHDDLTPPGDDWAWIALNPDPLADAPSIFYDLPTPVIFPPVAVLPLDQLRDVILDWCRTGERPAGVRWLAVNSQVWDLDEHGEVVPDPARPRRTIHTVIGNQVVREHGWGTGRTRTSRG
ncbi:Imm1 family immunity protein [Actinokineospora iranica]|uniref:Immunity protein Imm1 n=1 Tax=Actinokineospora iranica TaxID=1271860 RepID=A0A1G6YTJ0_9PSEU|nr:Imm1 family immunity protein [Actinokineospora iranica]SDD92866.1 Immunity protein Imm1 [Actinokineospora iranica]